MKCLILAAGRGTCMGALTDDCPKPMLPINGRPKLAYTVESLPDAIHEVVFVVGYLSEHIIDFFGILYAGRKISYVLQQELNGTGGAVMAARDALSGEGGEKFLVLMGDDLYAKEDLEKLLHYDFALLGFATDHVTSSALVQCDENNMLQEVIEWPHNYKKGLINTGAYMLSAAYFEMPLVLVNKKEYGVPQTLAAQKAKQPTIVVRTKKWFPIGDAKALEKAQTMIQDFIS